jgi:hypothetical protein
MSDPIAQALPPAPRGPEAAPGEGSMTLQSRLRGMQVFALEHATFCGPEGCACTSVPVLVTEENPRTGERARRWQLKLVPGSFTLLALERRERLSPRLLRLPALRMALARGSLRLVEERAAEPVSPVAAPPAPTKAT